jgi:hypothetical protein
MARELESSIGVGETNAAFGWQAHTSAFAGHQAEAHDQFRRGIQMSLQGSFTEVAAQLTMEDAENHAMLGQCEETRREVPEGLALSRDNSTLERASRALALCGAEREAMSLSSEVSKRFPDATLTNRMSVPVTAAMVAMARRDAQHALELLDPVKPYDHAPSSEFWPLYLRGQAYLELKDGRAAAVQFQSIVDHRGEVPASLLYPLAQLGIARGAALANDTERARKAYGDFVALWRDADADLQPLKEARVEYARLAGAPQVEKAKTSAPSTR